MTKKRKSPGPALARTARAKRMPQMALYVKAIQGGLNHTLAAKAAGVTYRGAHEWRLKGAADIEAGNEDTEYAQFLLAIQCAEAALAASMFNKIVAAANDPKSWAAAAWVLERRFGFTKAPEIEVNLNVSAADRELDAEFERVEVAVVDARASRKALPLCVGE